jgi:hypothetical protein
MASEQSSGRSNGSATQDKNSSWVGGWYVFEDGNVVGPLEASDAFSRSEKTDSGQARMVSRKGFSQWYPLQDFAAIHAMAGRYSDYLAEAKSTPVVDMPTVVAKQVGPRVQENLAAAINLDQRDISAISSAQKDLSNTGPSASDRVKFAQNSETTDTSQPVKKLSAKEKKRILEDERRAKKLAEKQAKQALKHQAKASNVGQPISFDQQYLQVASRLRLGRPASPVVRAVIFFPLTLGVYWWAWLAKTSEEVSWHLNGASRMNFVVPMWMCMIPGVHLVLAYLVARMVRQMEEQNGYRTVNPWVATLAALCPPLYIGIIQAALNRHWRLHVYHSVAR